MATDIASSMRADGARHRKRAVRLSTGDRLAIAVMVGRLWRLPATWRARAQTVAA